MPDRNNKLSNVLELFSKKKLKHVKNEKLKIIKIYQEYAS